MGLKRWTVGLFRRVVGFDAIRDEIAGSTQALTSSTGLSQSLILNINHQVMSIQDRLTMIEDQVNQINHRSIALEEVVPRIKSLDQINHRLQDFDSAALLSANQVAIDAESVSVMVRLVEKLLDDLLTEISRLSLKSESQ